MLVGQAGRGVHILKPSRGLTRRGMRVSTEQYDIKISGTLCLSDSVMYIVCLHIQICHVCTMKALWSTSRRRLFSRFGTLVYCTSPAEEPFWAPPLWVPRKLQRFTESTHSARYLVLLCTWYTPAPDPGGTRMHSRLSTDRHNTFTNDKTAVTE